MRTVSISELKARLSAFIDVVRGGDEVLVTDRGRAVARLSPVRGARAREPRRELLLRTGRLRAPTASLPENFWRLPRAVDATARAVASLIAERGEGR